LIAPVLALARRPGAVMALRRGARRTRILACPHAHRGLPRATSMPKVGLRRRRD